MTSSKKIFSFVLILFIFCFSLPVLSAEKSARVQKKDNIKIVLYYLHGSLRCHSCLEIERLLDKTLKTVFKNELRQGIIVWKPINKEEPENEHFMKDFKVTYNMAVLAEEKNGIIGRWKKLPLVWDLFSNERKFSEYIRNEVREYLIGNK